ncbi:acyl--CoA ligase [Rhodobacteraceae bacterium D3-12]|nr:acyl--CoA ligase [Rhodobacteraceae bacterium D3-12]
MNKSETPLPTGQSWPEIKAALDRQRADVEKMPFPRNIAALVDECLAKQPDAPLWTFFEEPDGGAATYAEVGQQIEQMAAALYSLGIRKGSHVAVMLPNIPSFPIAWLALAKLGAVMVPVNINYTGRELNYVLTDSDASYLLIHSECLPAYRALEGEAPVKTAQCVTFGATDGDDVLGQTDESLREQAAPLPQGLPEPALDDVINIQYTSGTTGFPKGCLLTHRYWITISLVASQRGGPAEDLHNILAAQPFFYMDPQWLTLMTMRLGGEIFVARRASSSRFMDWVRRFKIHYCLFPEVVYQLPAQDNDADNDLRRISIFGVSGSQHAALEERYNVIARESFGMTEVGGALFMPSEATHMVGSGACGLPAPFREAKIIDADGAEVADGEIGELCIRGPGIMLGYYKKPEANAASFLDGGWFRTGDLFKRDSDGFHTIVGRLKDMIRRSGENIAAREVETVLVELPGVVEAAAVGVKDPARGEEVKAYIVLSEGMSAEDLPPETVFEHCRTRLAAFKTPRYIEYRAELPKTPSEKIAKQLLIKEKPDLRQGSFDRVSNAWL